MRRTSRPTMCMMPAGEGSQLCYVAFPVQACRASCGAAKDAGWQRLCALVPHGARRALCRGWRPQVPQPIRVSRGQARGGPRCCGGRGGGREGRRRAGRRDGRIPDAVRIGAAGRALALRRGRRAPCGRRRGAAAPRARVRRPPGSPSLLKCAVSALSQKQCPDFRKYVRKVRVRSVREACSVRCVNTCARRRAPALPACVGVALARRRARGQTRLP